MTFLRTLFHVASEGVRGLILWVEVIVRPDKEAAVALVARIIAHELRANPSLVLGLATGKTMERVYHQLARLHQEKWRA
jgi:6-phosphogluconolactonase/glucosamine-6-phosphate isomerase/deaminase